MSQVPQAGDVWEVNLDIGGQTFHSIVVVLEPYPCPGCVDLRAYPGFCLVEGRRIQNFMYVGQPLPDSWSKVA